MTVDNDELKAECIALENVEAGLDHEKGPPVPEYTPEELKAVIRKLDWHLMPLCFLLYTFSVLDVSFLGPISLPKTFTIRTY